MKSHELAKKLLDLPNLSISTHAMGNTYNSVDDRYSHGEIKIGLLKEFYCDGDKDFIIIGDLSIEDMDKANSKLIEVFCEDEKEN